MLTSSGTGSSYCGRIFFSVLRSSLNLRHHNTHKQLITTSTVMRYVSKCQIIVDGQNRQCLHVTIIVNILININPRFFLCCLVSVISLLLLSNFHILKHINVCYIRGKKKNTTSLKKINNKIIHAYKELGPNKTKVIPSYSTFINATISQNVLIFEC